jgi:hypothetical protein
MLGPGRDLGLDPRLPELCQDLVTHLVEHSFPLRLALLHQRGYLGVALGMQLLEAQIFEFPLDCIHSEPVSQRSVDLERLSGDELAPLAAQGVDRAHVVEAVGDLHQQYTHVACGRHHHLAQVLGPCLLGGTETDAVELGDAIDQQRHCIAHLPLDVDEAQLRVLDRIVEQGRRHRGFVEPQLCADGGDAQGMRDERVAGFADLARVGTVRNLIGPLYQLGGATWTALPELSEELLEPGIAGLAGRPHAAQDRLYPPSGGLVGRRVTLGPLLNRVHISL